MDEIWVKWAEHYRNLGIDPREICKDGIIDQDKFEGLVHRVLFVFKEVERFPSGDLRELFRETVVGIGNSMAIWSAGIFNNFPEYKEVEKIDGNLLKQYLAKVAVFTLKKTSSKSLSKIVVIGNYIKQDRDLLLEQISLIKPVLIIACNTFDFLTKLLDLNVKVNASKQEPVVDKKRNAWVIPLIYPDNIGGERLYDKLKEKIWRKIDY